MRSRSSFLRQLGIALAVLLQIALAPTSHAAATAEIVLAPVQVSPHGWYFQGEAGMASVGNKGFMSNAGFVVTTEGVVVFDALGTPALGRAMIAAIRTVTPQPIRRVVVSHYHADHIYGLQELKAAGAEIWAHREAKRYLTSGQAEERLAQRRTDLFPWVDEKTVVVPPDLWLDGDVAFRMGGLTFELIYSGGAHSPEDLLMYVVEDRLLYCGDLIFAGRLPYVGNADSAGWLKAMDKMIALAPLVVVPGHGPVSRDVVRDLAGTRDYLAYLRETMGRAAHDLEPFDTAYAGTDWSKYSSLPAFGEANRANAYGTYLRMEEQELGATRR
jgi:glyoxylase-like metal-dependent hydrolase (beta-lactamase superfamily II)